MKKNQIRRIVLKRNISNTVSVAAKLLVMVTFLLPFYWMMITAFKTYAESIQKPPTLWPHEVTVEAFRTVTSYFNLWPYIRNTLIITVTVMALELITMVPAAYAFAKLKFKGKGILFTLVMISFMLPNQVTFISVYIMMSKAGLMKTLWPQILPFAANAYGIFLLRQNFKQISDELIESARLDNAGEFGIIYKLMLPIAKPTLVTVMLLSFINRWNAYFWPLVMCNDETVKPISLVIARLKDVEQGLVWPTMMAGNLLLVMPVLLLFLMASKKIIASMAYRGVK